MKEYIAPVVETYSKEELAMAIEVGACSSTYTCYCHSGTNNSE